MAVSERNSCYLRGKSILRVGLDARMQRQTIIVVHYRRVRSKETCLGLVETMLVSIEWL